MFTELFLRYPGFKTKALTLSYDDGVYQDRRMIEVLNRHNLKCTFNINGGLIGNGNRLPAEELPALYAGHEVAIHTLTHPHLQNLTLGQVAYQATEDRRILEEIFRKPIEGMAYPYGLSETPGQVDTLASCGVRYARTTVSTESFGLPTDYLRWHPTCHHANPRLKEMFANFMTPDDWEHPWRISCKLMYIWGHSYEFDDKWDTLDEMCELVSGHEEIWYATNGEIIDYLDAYRHLRCSINNKMIHNPTDITLYLFANNQNWVLNPGETIYL